MTVAVNHGPTRPLWRSCLGRFFLFQYSDAGTYFEYAQQRSKSNAQEQCGLPAWASEGWHQLDHLQLSTPPESHTLSAHALFCTRRPVKKPAAPTAVSNQTNGVFRPSSMSDDCGTLGTLSTQTDQKNRPFDLNRPFDRPFDRPKPTDPSTLQDLSDAKGRDLVPRRSLERIRGRRTNEELATRNSRVASNEFVAIGLRVVSTSPCGYESRSWSPTEAGRLTVGLVVDSKKGHPVP